MLKEQRSPDRTFESNPERDREVARTCMGRLSPDCSREDWVQIGMALHSLGEDMRELWHDWSSGGATYNRREADRQWDSFKRGAGVGLGTLIQMAGLTTDELRGIGGGSARGTHVPALPISRNKSAPVEPKVQQAAAPARTFPTLDAAVQACTPQGFTEAGRWRYRDDHWVVRFNGATGKRVVPFSCDDSGRWVNRGPSHRTLYGQDSLPEDMDDTVIVVEGEKCADIAATLGFPAVTSGASSSAGVTDWSALAGRQVVVLPDQDDAGAKYAAAVRDQLDSHGCSVSVLELPGLGTGQDIEQWAQREGENAGAALKQLVAEACDDCPLPNMLERMDSMLDRMEKTQGRQFIGLPCGMSQLDRMLDGFRGLVFMSGAPGCGKTNLALQASAGVVGENPDAAVLFVTLEMSSDELMARLICQFASGDRLDWHALVKGQGIDADERARVVTEAQGLLAPVLPRLQMLGQTDLHRMMQGGTSAMSALRKAVRSLKRKTGAKRCMVVIDNFAHLPMRGADMTDLELERQKTAELLQFQEQIGEAVLVIAQQSKEDLRSGQGGVAAVKGAVEQVYAADAVLTMTRSKNTAIEDPRGPNRLGAHRLSDRNGEPLPVVKLRLAKGRDGMNRRDMHLMFDHELFQMVELQDEQIERTLENTDA